MKKGSHHKESSKQKISNNKERAKKISKALKGRKKSYTVWNKGLTKESDSRVAKNAINMQKTKEKKYKGKTYEQIYGLERAKIIKNKLHTNCPGWKHNKETKQKMKINSKGKNKGNKAWNRGLTKETDERISKYAKKLTGLKRSEECKNKMRETRKEMIDNGWKPAIFDKEFYEKHGIKKSKYPYNEKFDKKLKQKVRYYYNNQCVVTGMSNDEHKQLYGCSLIVHHWNYDKSTDDSYWMVPVCRPVNSYVEHDKEAWMSFFGGIVQEKIDNN